MKYGWIESAAEFLPDCYRQKSDNKTDATSSAVLSRSFSSFAENPLTSSSSIDWRIQALRRRRHNASARAGRRACAAARAASATRSHMTASRAADCRSPRVPQGGAGFVRPLKFVSPGPAQQVVEFHPRSTAPAIEPDHGEPQTKFGPRRVIAGEVKTIPLSAANTVKRRAARAVNPDLFESQAAGEGQSHYNVAMKILEQLASGGAGAASTGPGRFV